MALSLTIAVNVSAVQIYNANFPHTIHEILFETDSHRRDLS